MSDGKDEAGEVLTAAEIHAFVLDLVEAAQRRGVDCDTAYVPPDMAGVAGWRDGDEIVPGGRVRLVKVEAA